MDRAAYAGVGNLVGRDDMGHLLLESSSGRESSDYSNYPDEVFLHKSLTAAHPRATRLAWLEGEVMTYRSLVPINLTFPLGPNTKHEPVTEGDLTAEFISFNGGDRPELRARVFYPREAVLATVGIGNRFGPFPELVGQSGKVYRSNQYSGGGDFDPDRTIVSGTWRFSALPERVTAARFRLLLKSDPQPYFKFRSTNIPLPSRIDNEQNPNVPQPDYPDAGPATLRLLPPLGLKLEKATAQEAAAQLAKASGQLIEVPATELPTARDDYDWTRLTWPEALRDLKKRYDFATSKSFTGEIKLDHSFTIPPPIIAKRPVEFTKGGVRVSLQSVHQSAQHQRTFTAPTDSQSHVNSSVLLAVRTGPIDPLQLAGIAKVRAIDDRNQELREGFRSISTLSPTHLQLPDALQTNVRLTGPAAEARSLKSLEGDLLIYRDFGQLRIAFNAPVSETPQKRDAGAATFELSGSVPRAGGKQLFTRLRIIPKDSQTKLQETLVVLIGASGKRYGLSSAQGGGLGNGSDGVVELNTGFRDIPEAVDRIEALATWQSQPVRLFRFRLDNLPLPPEPAFEPLRQAPKIPKVAPDRAGMPLYDAKGGTLVFKVRLGKAPAPIGTLRVGLIEKDGPVRWFELRLAEDGSARLEATRPGVYRLLQSYRADQAQSVGPRGKWLNTETTLEAKAGKTSEAPPLRWVAQ